VYERARLSTTDDWLPSAERHDVCGVCVCVCIVPAADICPFPFSSPHSPVAAAVPSNPLGRSTTPCITHTHTYTYISILRVTDPSRRPSWSTTRVQIVVVFASKTHAAGFAYDPIVARVRTEILIPTNCHICSYRFPMCNRGTRVRASVRQDYNVTWFSNGFRSKKTTQYLQPYDVYNNVEHS